MTKFPRLPFSRKDISKNDLYQILWLIVSLFGIPVWLYLFHADLFESILVGASFFLVPHIYFIHKHSSKVASTVDSVKISDEKLNKVDKGYNDLKKDPQKKFFVEWYANEFTYLERKMNKTLEHEYITFPVRRLSDKESPIYKVFNEKDCNFLWATCTCEGMQWWLSQFGEPFIKHIDAKEGITQIRRIFIFDENDFNTDLYGNKKFKPLVQFGLALHQKGKYECRLIKKEEYDNHYKREVTLNEDEDLETDFGICGGRYVWETMDSYKGGMFTRGRFSKEENKVNAYREFFSNLWTDDKEETTAFINQHTEPEIIKKCKDSDITQLKDLYQRYEAGKKFTDDGDYGYA